MEAQRSSGALLLAGSSCTQRFLGANLAERRGGTAPGQPCSCSLRAHRQSAAASLAFCQMLHPINIQMLPKGWFFPQGRELPTAGKAFQHCLSSAGKPGGDFLGVHNEFIQRKCNSFD